jgi:hypothetical protein
LTAFRDRSESFPPTPAESLLPSIRERHTARMRVLRFGTSNDDAGALPLERRGWRLAEGTLAEALGEQVETILKRAWPDERFPNFIDKCIRECQPDMVVLQVNNFWYGHESAPLWFERRLGRAGAALNSAALHIGKSAWMADNRWVQMVNRRVLAVLPKATHFTISEVATAMEAAMRRVTTHESIVLLVRGNENWAVMPMATRGFNRRNAARNAAMSNAMRGLCERMRVPYFERPVVPAGELETQNGAGFHNNEEGERQLGAFDAEAMLTAWRAAQKVGPVADDSGRVVNPSSSL